jgi:hypothetical protein
MSAVAIIPASSQDQLAEPVRAALSGNSMLAVLLAIVALLLLLALGAVIAAARLLLEPIFALIGTLFRVLVIVGAAVAVVVLLVSGSAHAAGPGATGAGRPATGPLR